MTHSVPTRTAVLWTTATIIAAIGSWALFTGWGVTASYVGSHVGLAPDADIQHARTRARVLFAAFVGAQPLLIWCAAQLVSSARVNRRGISNLGLSFALAAVTDALTLDTLLLLEVAATR